MNFSFQFNLSKSTFNFLSGYAVANFLPTRQEKYLDIQTDDDQSNKNSAPVPWVYFHHTITLIAKQFNVCGRKLLHPTNIWSCSCSVRPE